MSQTTKMNVQGHDYSPQRKKQKQKTSEDIFQHFLLLYQPSQKLIDPYEVLHQIQDIHQLLSRHPKNRDQKVIKKIKAELSQLKCFKIPPFNQQNPQFNQIFKRDVSNIIKLVAPFIQITKYSKGSIIEATAMKRKSIKILLMGQIQIFQPINYKSFKNCKQRLKNNELNIPLIQNCHQHLDQFFVKQKKVQKQNPQLKRNKEEQNLSFITNHQQVNQNLGQKKQVEEVKEMNISEQQQDSQIFIGQQLTINQCRTIVTKCNIISPLSIHKNGRKLKYGDYVFDKDQLLFVDQKDEYNSTVICRTDSVFIELGYSIAKQVINLINNDRQRPYILSLLFAFPMLKYFQAKQYVTQEFMIANSVQQQDGVKISKKSAIQIIKELKVISSLNFQLSFTSDLYLIISGQVILKIDEVHERKSSTAQYITPQKRTFNKQILHLFKNDLFGFQQIGLIKQANLKYTASMGSKLLKINKDVLKNHLQSIQGFADYLQKMKKTRNELIRVLINKMEQNLQQQEIKRHSNITYSKSEHNLAKIKSVKSTQLSSQVKQIMNLKFLGYQKFQQVSSKIKKHFSPENTGIPKQSLSPQIVKQSGLGIQFSSNLLRRPSQKIQINNGWIQIRDSKGKLLRKKKVKQSDKSIDVQKGDALLRRLGFLSSKQIADHNHFIVKNRPSLHQFEDINKEAKQFKRIRQKIQSLPKLKNFFAKKQDRLFSILYKKTHL